MAEAKLQGKKAYVAPKLEKLGKMADITLKSGASGGKVR